MNNTLGKKVVLGLQHVLAMFGATVLVPLLTGLDSSIALVCAGIGTLIFHSVTKGKVPVFLGSSFAFIGAITLVLKTYGLAAVKGGLIVAGLVYVVFALLIKLVGYHKVTKLLPPVVTGPMIIVIGLRLSGTAISSALYKANEDNTSSFSPIYALITLFVILVIIGISVFTKGFINLMPILIAIIAGCIFASFFGLLNFNAVKEAKFFSLLDENIRTQVFSLPEFNLSAILAIAPIAIVTMIEHVGDITTNGAVVGKNFMEDPGVHRTILGDGLATMFAGLCGGPANTTYGENTGVLAVTKNYDPSVIRIAAVFAIILGMFGKFGALIKCIPGPVSGAISIILFGMIASVGVRILIHNKVNFSNSRNLMIASLIFVLGIGISADIPITDTVSISGLAIAAVVGILFAAILPENAGKQNEVEE